MLEEKIKQLQKIIDESSNIVFFGGAGVSTASGLKDFRGENGLYKEKFLKTPEYYLSAKCLYEEPNVFFDFYRTNMNPLGVQPNVVHTYLTQLEKNGKLKAIITQNIDNLHQLAGSKNVLEIHGSMYQNYCINCHKKYEVETIFNGESVPICECGGLIRPNVVLYGETLPVCFDEAILSIRKAETLIVAGTSLTVEPASSLVRLFRGKNLVILNKDATPYDELATLRMREDLTKIFSKLK